MRIAAAQMLLDDFLGRWDERLVRTLSTFHLWLAANPSHGVFRVKLNSFWHVHAPERLDPKREPVFAMQSWRPHRLTSGRALSARTIVPHA